MKSELDKKFKHSSFYKGENLTKKEFCDKTLADRDAYIEAYKYYDENSSLFLHQNINFI